MRIISGRTLVMDHVYQLSLFSVISLLESCLAIYVFYLEVGHCGTS